MENILPEVYQPMQSAFKRVGKRPGGVIPVLRELPLNEEQAFRKKTDTSPSFIKEPCEYFNSSNGAASILSDRSIAADYSSAPSPEFYASSNYQEDTSVRNTFDLIMDISGYLLESVLGVIGRVAYDCFERYNDTD